MSLKNLKNALGRLKDALIKRAYYADKDEKGLRKQTYSSQITTNLGFVGENIWKIMTEIKEENRRLELLLLLKKLKEATDAREMLLAASQMERILESIKEKKASFSFRVTGLPPTVKEEIVADIEEMHRCYQAQCYRSCIILCGRILEVALHRKYFEVTQRDILEKNPGIGLGTLVKKLMEKEIQFDPGLTQQIHLINNVRVSSVHKKQQVFKPSAAQAHATMLFTLDVLEKLF